MTETEPSEPGSSLAATPLLLFLIRLAALAATALTLWLAFKAPGAESPLIPWDKAGHFLSFYVLTILFTLALPRSPRLVIALVLILAGGAIELGQGMVGRDADGMDWIADIAGVTFAVAPVWLEAVRRWMRGPETGV